MGDTPDQIRQGDELTASRLNEWAGYASGVPLEVGDGLESASGSKRLLAARRARPIVAKLTGSSSPYSWTSQANTAAGTYANHAITGTTNAYEVNGVSGLASKVVRLYPDGHGKYNFQYLNCCGGGGCTGTVTLTFLCGATAVSGVSVTITQGVTSYSGTTNGSGQVTFSPTTSGTWSVSASKAGYVSLSTSFVFSCANISITYGLASTSTSVSGSVSACGVAVPGATVTVSDASGVVATTTTDGSGNYTTGLIGHLGTTLTIAASGYRLATGTATRTVTCGSSATANFNLSAATGDRCLCSGKIGSASTLNFTSSGYSATLTYGTGPASGLGAYSGTFTASCRSITGGGCTKGTSTVTFAVEFVPACTLVVYYNRVSTSGGTTVCTTPAVRVAPSSDAYCATLPAFPGGPECRLDTLGTNGDVPTLVSAVGGPISATPFVATFSGILFRDADDVAFLTDAVVSE